ncbi:hypothetical protein ACFVWY_03390 [Streptomyces sp. NPDC058195]|uniref:hypothetical protein n=1 Tax=Streptomyces sp. NPDC058195 TaxID=3346375 RepID=UPI0036EB0537
MIVALVISAVIAVGFIGYLVSLFKRDHDIRWNGRDVRALVEDVRHIGTNDAGSFDITYRLSWQEDGEKKMVEGRDTIPARRFPQLRAGSEVAITYLDDRKIMFLFDA